MANSGGGGKGSGNMSRGAGGRRSVGAAGGGKPNGAILDDTAEVLLQRKQRFAAWKKGYRDKSLTENAFTKMYKEPNPVKGN